MSTADTPIGLSAAAAKSPQKPLLARWWRTLRSLRFALVLMALIAVACIVGTLVKQEPYDPTKAIADYGRPLGLLIGLLGLGHLYHTWWFLALLSLFALSTVACTVPRLRLRLGSLGSAVVHLSIVFIVAGALVKGLVGQEGMVNVPEGQAADCLQTDGGAVPLGFGLRLDDFDIEYYDAARDLLLIWPDPAQSARQEPVRLGQPIPVGPDGTTVEVLRYVPHFFVSLEDKKVTSASDNRVNPAIQVRVRTPEGESTRWLFAKFPDMDTHHGHATGGGPPMRYVRQTKSYASHVTVLDQQGEELRKATVRVNEPLKVGRYTFYQSGYDTRTEQATTLEVVYDPGVPLVFAGFVLMPFGIAFVFYIQPLLRRTRATAE